MDNKGAIPLQYNPPPDSKMLPIRPNNQSFSLPMEESFNGVGKDQFHHQNGFYGASQTNGAMPGYSLCTRAGVPNLLPLSQSSNVRGGNAIMNRNLNDLMKAGSSVHTKDFLVGRSNITKECSRSSELPHQCIVKPDTINELWQYSDSRNIGIFHDMAQSDIVAVLSGSRSAVSASSMASAITELRKTLESLPNKEQLGTSIYRHDNYKKSDHNYCDVKTIESLEVSDTKNSENSLKDSELTNTCVTSTKTFNVCEQRSDHHPNSIKLKEKDELAKSLVATAAEKIWEGSIQLNCSVTVPVVACFKSGERLPYINWSEFVEVKGKVRLEAFEKYIQDLPRSRNRGLMVVSLCWKNGSSDTGLAGMKEVGKKLEDGGKVALAQLSAGVDLYICPRSDPMITILAKHGFFKGMVAAIKGNLDSLIGCVVWRKNQFTKNPNPATSVSPKNETKLPIMPLVNDNKVVDDDDLPEFDFKKIQSPLNVPNCVASETHEKIKATESMVAVNGGGSPKKRAREYESEPQGMGFRQRNIFDDDDDMPEWEPPESSSVSLPTGSSATPNAAPHTGFSHLRHHHSYPVFSHVKISQPRPPGFHLGSMPWNHHGKQ